MVHFSSLSKLKPLLVNITVCFAISLKEFVPCYSNFLTDVTVQVEGYILYSFECRSSLVPVACLKILFMVFHLSYLEKTT